MELHPRYIILCIAAGLLKSITVPAQALPQLPRDSRIQTGTLRCGIPYYMVSGSSEKGYADFAVIRSGVEDTAFDGTAFLSRSGVSPRREGFALRQGGSTLLRFDHVPVHDPAVLDSMLLVSFAALSASDGPQALVIAGDVDPVEVRKKMDIFSMLVRRRPVPDGPSESYHWHPRTAPSLSFRQGAPATLRVTYYAPRVPSSDMNTARALVTEQLGGEFMTIAAHRLEHALQDAAIPYGTIRFFSRGSAEALGDESYSLEVTTSPRYIEKLDAVVSACLASIDAYGVTVEEFVDAKRILYPEMVRKANLPPSNAVMADRCIAHFLYGADLAPGEERLRLFSRKSVSDSVEARLFNNFTAALLDPLENLSLRYTAQLDSLDLTEAICRYYRGYLQGEMTRPERRFSWRADTLGLGADCPRVKVKSEKADPVSGGSMWTFSNGIRVVYRQIPRIGYFSYAMVLPGGLAQIRGLYAGEGGYIGDMFSLYQAGGLPNRNFRDLLSSQGITILASADQNATIIRGEAHSSGLSLLLKSLLSLANERIYDDKAFEIYTRNALEQEPTVDDLLYGMMNPEEVCAVRRDRKSLSLNTRLKAESLFEERFSRVNDGVIVLAGDVEPATVKKLLGRYLGGFRTSKTSFQRKSAKPQQRIAASLKTIPGEYPGAEIRLEAPCSMTGVNVFAAEITAEAMRTHLLRSFAPGSVSIQVRSGISAHPEERLWMRLSIAPTSSEADMTELLSTLRAAILSAPSAAVSASDLKAWKNRSLAWESDRLSMPEGVVDALILRYGSGKDLVTRYKENLAAVDAQRVQDMLRSLAGGAKAELLVE